MAATLDVWTTRGTPSAAAASTTTRGDRAFTCHIRAHRLDVERLEALEPPAVAERHPHAVAALGQRPGHVAAHEPGRAGHAGRRHRAPRESDEFQGNLPGRSGF